MDVPQKNSATAPAKFQIPVHHNRVKNNQVTALHLMVALICIVPGIIVFLTPPVTGWIDSRNLSALGLFFTGIGTAILIIALFFNRKVIQRPTRNIPLRGLEIAALACILTYSITQQWWMPVAYSAAALCTIIFAYFWEKSAQQSFFIEITDKQLTLPRFAVPKHILWQDIEKILLKHRILTVILRNNKIYQLRLRSDADVDAASICAFCQHHIDTNKERYRPDW